jgi:hypothetical protein
MQARGRGASRPPIGIAFEGDLGRRIDALLVPALLNGLAAKGAARSVALCISTPSLRTAQLAEVVARFYSNRPGNQPAMIGMPEGSVPNDAPPVAAVLAKTAEDGSQPYESRITSVLDTADNAVHIRNVLLAQHDGNGAIVVAGPLTGMARLLALYGAPPQVEAKVRHLVVALGAYPAGAADPDLARDVASARKVFAEWPAPIVAVGQEVGEALPFPGATLAQDFEWAAHHPVADAYRLAGKMPYDAPAPALAAALYAAQPDEGYFAVSEPGTISVLDDGRTTFTPDPSGRHRYLKPDPAQKARVVALYGELVSAQPQRGGRRGGPPQNQQQEQQQKQPPRKAPPEQKAPAQPSGQPPKPAEAPRPPSP